MSDPLSRTFDVLASTAHPLAADVLVAALDTDDPRIRARAAAALLRRAGTRGQVELLRRWPRLDDQTRAVIERHAAPLTGIVRQCVLHGQAMLKLTALEFIRRTELYDLTPLLLELLAGAGDVPQDALAETLQCLTNRLYDHLRHRTDELAGGVALRGASQIRLNLLLNLDRSIDGFEQLRRPEVVVESILVLGDPDHFAVRKVLTQAPPPCRELASRLLLESRHPGVMQLVLEFMGKNYPHPKAFEAFQRRGDIEFVCHVLRWFPARLTPLQQQNFRQVPSLAWLGPNQPLESIPPPLQAGLVRLLAATGLPSGEKLRVQEWLVRHGCPEGRLAAADILTSLDRHAVREILVEGLESPDEQVQAWATGQLRSHGIPHALTLLVERLDSPLDAVREAARAALRGFDADRALSLCERLDPPACRRLGELLLKIDPECVSKLAEQLSHPVRRRRLQAVSGAQALGLHGQLVPGLLRLLNDDDVIVRRTAVEVLSSLPSADVLRALERMQADPSPRVREAAERAVDVLRRGGAPEAETVGAS